MVVAGEPNRALTHDHPPDKPTPFRIHFDSKTPNSPTIVAAAAHSSGVNASGDSESTKSVPLARTGPTTNHRLTYLASKNRTSSTLLFCSPWRRRSNCPRRPHHCRVQSASKDSIHCSDVHIDELEGSSDNFLEEDMLSFGQTYCWVEQALQRIYRSVMSAHFLCDAHKAICRTNNGTPWSQMIS